MSEAGSISVRLYRYDPSLDEGPRYETFEVPMMPHMRILDALDYIYESLGHTFAYRWFCGTKRCGMCAVTVDGEPLLSCWEPARPTMQIEPLEKFPVVRDLVVDFGDDERRLTELGPVMARTTAYQGFPEAVTHEDMRRHFDLMRCIDCRICVAACSVVDPAGSNGFAGPYALVQLAKVALDPRNGRDLSASVLSTQIQECLDCNDCVTACPNDVPVLNGAIEPLREQLKEEGRYPEGPDPSTRGIC